LVIVKHSSELLSAYSFNGKMLVAEQQQVGGGEVIADILPRPGVGQTLHFELRRKGLPINPQTLIR
jgi:lipoprotein NlpD